VRETDLLAGFARPEDVRGMLGRLDSLDREYRLMEVCGTHTMALFETGLRPALRERRIQLLSGPGCPVCVTAQRDLDHTQAVARLAGVILCTFGDMLRVPGSTATLEQLRAEGCDVRVVYSPLDAVELAGRNPDRRIVFLGIGFETTAPAVACAALSACAEQLDNFYVFPLNKLVPPALAVLASRGDLELDGLLLPGHVSVVIGSDAYLPIADDHSVPCAIAGFEPADILAGILSLVDQCARQTAIVDNCYRRVVRPDGNPAALSAMWQVFEPVDAEWRGFGVIQASGLGLRDEFLELDARRLCPDFKPVAESPALKNCRCGDVLCGVIAPTDCGSFGSACTPESPLGACMVSHEGACRAYYRYHGAP
jgi:hydrogenase expression/formation protein HypD